MAYILYISNKEAVNPFYEDAWYQLANELNIGKDLFRFLLLKGTADSIPTELIKSDCKAVIINWMGQNDDKRLLAVFDLAKVKQIPVMSCYTFACLPAGYLIDDAVKSRIADYLRSNGAANTKNLFLFVLAEFLHLNLVYTAPKELPWAGIYLPGEDVLAKEEYYEKHYDPAKPTVVVHFPREHWVWGQLAYVDMLVDELRKLGCNALPIFSHWNRNKEQGIPAFEENFNTFAKLGGKVIPSALINCLWFSLTVGRDIDDRELLKNINIPIIQGEILLQDINEWQNSRWGLEDNEIQANIVMPEFDGVIHGVPIAGRQRINSMIRLVPIKHNITLLALKAFNWARLKQKKNTEKHVALIFHNYPAGNATIGTAMALDSLRSGEIILQALKEKGYETGELPQSKGWLAERILSSFTNEISFFKKNSEIAGDYPIYKYAKWYDNLLAKNKNHITDSWGEAPGKEFIADTGESFKIAGFIQGNIFVSVQPPRIAHGCLVKSFHNGDIPPTHYYLAYYRWLAEGFKADAVIHLGTHGTLEWLPGKSTGLSNDSYPYLAIDALPNLYPYLISITCEGLQAKRRGAAVLIDHLPAPCEESGLYGNMLEVNSLVDQYLEAYPLGSPMLSKLESVITSKLESPACDWFDGLKPEKTFYQQMEDLHLFLEKISAGQCRTGLHVLGEIPAGKDLEALLKSVNQGNDELNEGIIEKLVQTPREITNILAGLSGNYIESGLSGAPTTGMLDCLPSGKNFYGVDPRLLPSPAAWLMGKDLAEQVIQLYIQEESKYPERIAMILWSGTNMRTKGCDIAQAMALIGIEPVWSPNGRINGMKVIPLDELRRPRIDVVCRISGMYRDSLYPTVEYLDACIKKAMALEEDVESNYLRKHLAQDAKEFAGEEISALSSRIFGSAPGTYGAGVNLTIEGRCWQSIDDLRDVFVSWGSYAYGKQQRGQFLPDIFSSQLSKVDVTVKNEDHYEVTMLESDDYNAFHGGLIAAVRSLSGKAPKSYCGNLSDRKKIKVQTLSEEMQQLYLSQVLNPKFINGMKKHGYKGAADLCNIVSHSFAWDATSNVIENWMYNELVERYIRDLAMNKWLRKVNPWALQKMCSTLLEAKHRQLWAASQEVENFLVKEYLDIEGELEEFSDA